MKTDTYTKAVLTVIALALTFNIIKELNVVPKAYANETEKPSFVPEGYTLVPIEAAQTMDVRIVGINTSNELNVNLKRVDAYNPIKVDLNKVSTRDNISMILKKIDTYDKLDVNLKEYGGRAIYSNTALPVKIE